jgi:hypothetical protein
MKTMPAYPQWPFGRHSEPSLGSCNDGMRCYKKLTLYTGQISNSLAQLVDSVCSASLAPTQATINSQALTCLGTRVMPLIDSFRRPSHCMQRASS